MVINMTTLLQINNHKENLIKFSKEGKINDIYKFLFTLSLDELVKLLSEMHIKCHNEETIKRLVILDSEFEIVKKHLTLNIQNKKS